MRRTWAGWPAAAALLLVVGGCASGDGLRRDDSGIEASGAWTREGDGRWALSDVSPRDEADRSLGTEGDGRLILVVEPPEGATGARVTGIDVAYTQPGTARWAVVPGSAGDDATPIWVREVDIPAEAARRDGSQWTSHAVGVEVDGPFRLVFTTLAGAPEIAAIRDTDAERLRIQRSRGVEPWPAKARAFVAVRFDNLGRGPALTPVACETGAYTGACRAVHDAWQRVCEWSHLTPRLVRGGAAVADAEAWIAAWSGLQAAEATVESFAVEHAECIDRARGCRVDEGVLIICDAARQRLQRGFSRHLTEIAAAVDEVAARAEQADPSAAAAEVEQALAERRVLAWSAAQAAERFAGLAPRSAAAQALFQRAQAAWEGWLDRAPALPCRGFSGLSAARTIGLLAAVQSWHDLHAGEQPELLRRRYDAVRLAGRAEVPDTGNPTLERVRVDACVVERADDAWRRCVRSSHWIERRRDAPEDDWGPWAARAPRDTVPWRCEER